MGFQLAPLLSYWDPSNQPPTLQPAPCPTPALQYAAAEAEQPVLWDSAAAPDQPVEQDPCKMWAWGLKLEERCHSLLLPEPRAPFSLTLTKWMRRC